MALVSETALIGGFHPLHPEISELAAAVASPEQLGEISVSGSRPGKRKTIHGKAKAFDAFVSLFLLSRSLLARLMRHVLAKLSMLMVWEVLSRNMEDIRLAREALVSKSNEHALWDTAGIIAFFATITTVVDFAGHFSDELPKVLKKLAKVISSGRHLRATCRRVLCCQTA